MLETNKPPLTSTMAAPVSAWWECHICNEGPFLYAIHKICAICSHAVCNDCKKDDAIAAPLGAAAARVRSNPIGHASGDSSDKIERGGSTHDANGSRPSNSAIPRSGNAVQSTTTPTATPNAHVPQALGNLSDRERHWLLIYLRPRKLPTSLNHLLLYPGYDDSRLFSALNDTYRSLKGIWHCSLSLTGVRAINFVKVCQKILKRVAPP